MAADECCPKFDPQPWEEKEIVWKDKLFVHDTVRSFFHIPLNMGQVVTRMCTPAQATGAVPEKDWLLLSEETSAWKSEQYLSVTKEVSGLDHVRISGTFFTRVFEGPYQNAKQWYGELVQLAKDRGAQPGRVFFFYTTCPKCAQKWGKNYVVGLVQIG